LTYRINIAAIATYAKAMNRIRLFRLVRYFIAYSPRFVPLIIDTPTA
jgi:hypothetical protein